MPYDSATLLRTRLLLALAVLVIAGAVWGVAQVQRDTADRAYREAAAAERLLAGMLDQQTGLRGFALTRQEEFLAPFREGVREYVGAQLEIREISDEGDAALVGIQTRAAVQWQKLARGEISVLRADPDRQPSTVGAVERKRVFDRFRAGNDRYRARLEDERAAELARAGTISVAVILILGLVFGGLGLLIINRSARRSRDRRARDRAYRESQAEFNETMQIMRDEVEAHDLVKRHLERTIAGSSIVVLGRNNSKDRLTASTAVPEASPLGVNLANAHPESCLAVRLTREYDQPAGRQPLLACELCGASAKDVTCVPSVVSGEVIGAVHIEHERPLAPLERDRVDATVSQSAPVLANLRNLAVAEARAATDALTGLANRRACHDTLKRMVAHAGRAVSPLSAIVLDLDHFKQVNDRFGHGAGDDVLAATGGVLASVTRSSDFAGRYGGEEFLVLLPDTDAHGALELAEKLRAAIAAIEVPQVDREITASFGVATYPADAGDGDGLVRMADRALYAAKRAGRNRVELVGAGDVPDVAVLADVD